MARKITEQSVNAFMDGVSFRRDNTHVTRDGRFYLWGHLIAEKLNDRQIKVSDCGWCTRTTYERLHHLIMRWTNGKYGASMRNGGIVIDMENNIEKPLVHAMMFAKAIA